MKSKWLVLAALLSGLIFTGCTQREEIYYLPQEKIPTPAPAVRFEELPVEPEQYGSESIVTPILPLE